jgi:hypothetical protein
MDLWVVLVAGLGAARWALRRCAQGGCLGAPADPRHSVVPLLRRGIGWILSPLLHTGLAALAAWSVGKIGTGGVNPERRSDSFAVAPSVECDTIVSGERVPDSPRYPHLLTDDPAAESPREGLLLSKPLREDLEEDSSVPPVPSESERPDLVKTRIRREWDRAAKPLPLRIADPEGASGRDRTSVSEGVPPGAAQGTESGRGEIGAAAYPRPFGRGPLAKRSSRPMAPGAGERLTLVPGVPRPGMQVAAVGKLLRDLEAKLIAFRGSPGVLAQVKGLLARPGGARAWTPVFLAARSAFTQRFLGPGAPRASLGGLREGGLRSVPVNLDAARPHVSTLTLNGTDLRPLHASANAVLNGTRGNPAGGSLNGSDVHPKH